MLKNFYIEKVSVSNILSFCFTKSLLQGANFPKYDGKCYKRLITTFSVGISLPLETFHKNKLSTT